MVGVNKEHRSLRASHMKNLDWRTILLSTFITAFGITAWHQLAPHTNQANLKRELESKAQQINDQLDKLEGQQKKTNEQKKEIEKLKKQLQAKKAEKARLSKAVIYAESAPEPSGAVFTGSGDKYLDWIISKESGGNKYAINASSGACGLFQALPCSKLGCDLSDLECQLDWGRNYVNSRYGSAYNAYLFWLKNHWY